MSEWTREHDAHIARTCEGQNVAKNELGTWLYQKPVSEHCASHWAVAPFYQHDANARDRAAEAWRKKEMGREYIVKSAIAWGKRSKPARAVVMAFTSPAVKEEGEHALLWALWKATGGEK